MSEFKHKPNTGSLFKNDRKETDTQPDYKGTADIEGEQYYLNGWINERKDGTGKFIKLSWKKKELSDTNWRQKAKENKLQTEFSEPEQEVPF